MMLKFPKKDEAFFWEKSNLRLRRIICTCANDTQTAQSCDVVDLRRVELRSYKVRLRTLHA